MQNGLISHPCVVNKNSGGMSQEQGVTAPQLDPSPGFQCQEDKSPPTSGCKNQRALSQWKKLLKPQAVFLKEDIHILTYSDSLPLSSNTRAVA